jgi:hypothetical protein
LLTRNHEFKIIIRRTGFDDAPTELITHHGDSFPLVECLTHQHKLDALYTVHCIFQLSEFCKRRDARVTGSLNDHVVGKYEISYNFPTCHDSLFAPTTSLILMDILADSRRPIAVTRKS